MILYWLLCTLPGTVNSLLNCGVKSRINSILWEKQLQGKGRIEESLEGCGLDNLSGGKTIPSRSAGVQAWVGFPLPEEVGYSP